MKKLVFFCVTIFSLELIALDQSFYENFWKIAQTPVYGNDLVLKPGEPNESQDLIFKVRTGYGISVPTSNTLPSFNQQTPYQRIITVFNNCLTDADINSDSSNCPVGINQEIIDKIKRIKFYTTALEQCYANIIPGQSETISTQDKMEESTVGIEVNGVNRNQTKLEKNMGMECSITNAKAILDQIYNKGLIASSDYTASSSNKANEVKVDIRNIHRLLTQKIKDAKRDLIIEVNKALDSEQAYTSFIDLTEISDKNSTKEVFETFNDIVKIDSYLPPMTLISRLYQENPEGKTQKIMLNGELVNITELSAKNPDPNSSVEQLANEIANKRNGKKQALSKMILDQKKLINSFGILKQNAMFNITNIINERSIPEGETHSMLYTIENTIDNNLKISSTAKVEPSLLLKQIRDALNLSNKLNLMMYIAQEKIQMSLAATQLSGLNSLADVINKNAKDIEKIAFEIDMGSDMVENNQ